MATKREGISAGLIIHPGETIADILAERGMTAAELAANMGISPDSINDVIGGRKDISFDLAAMLEEAFDVPRSFWLNLQRNYDVERCHVT